MQELRQGTTTTLKIGPFLSSSDGFTPVTNLTIGQAEVRLAKNGGAFAQKNDSQACAHNEYGYYDCQVNATDTATHGRLRVSVIEAGALPVFHDFMVIAQQLHDSKYGADKLQVDVQEIGNLSINSNLATLKLKVLSVINSAGDAIIAQSTGSNGNGIAATGHGTGKGISAAEIAAISTAIGNLNDPTVAQIVAGLNNLSSAEAQAAVIAALTAYRVLALGSGPNAVTWSFGVDGLPLDDAIVYVYDAGGQLVRKDTTDESGEVSFYLANGTYTIKATKDGYNTITGTKTVPEA